MHAVLLPKHRITRLLNAARHPDQAAIAARLPIAGDRVPFRAYWKRQPIDRRRVWSRGVASLKASTPLARERAARIGGRAVRAAEERWPAVRDRAAQTGAVATQSINARLPEVRQRAAHAGQMAAAATAAATRSSASAGATGARTLVKRAPRGRLTVAALAFSIGALVMYLFDRNSGRRRRALVRDRFTHVRRILTRDVRRAAKRRGRFVKGVARGVRHDAAELLPHRHAHVDDETLLARVRSEVLRRAEVPPGDIHVDVYEGCVTLRGQVDGEADIRRVVDATRRIDGVTDVRSYLHLPGTPPPNKAEAMANGHAPAHPMS
jgi:hyperosmotically inducible periplasmic protein